MRVTHRDFWPVLEEGRLFLLALAAVVAGSILLTGATDEREEGADWLPRYGGMRNGDDADARGYLVREGDCLYVDQPGYARILPIWPASARYLEDEDVLLLDGHRFHLGDYIGFGGSGVEGVWAADSLDVFPASGCDVSFTWGVGNDVGRRIAGAYP